MKTMTVAELRAALERLPGHLIVAFAQPTHDYWGTVLAVGVSRVERENVAAGSRDGDDALFVIDRHDDDDEEHPDQVEVILLR